MLISPPELGLEWARGSGALYSFSPRRTLGPSLFRYLLVPSGNDATGEFPFQVWTRPVFVCSR
jgi:hypothetical protein